MEGNIDVKAGTTPLQEQVTARHNRWVWFNATVIAVACLVAVVSGPDIGAFILAGLLLLCGAIRLVSPAPGPAGLTIRSRYLDVAMFWVSSALIGFLALTAPLI